MPLRTTALLAILATASAVAVATAQTPTGMPAAPRCARASTPDTALVIAYLTWPGRKRPKARDMEAYVFHAQVVTEQFHGPKAVSVADGPARWWPRGGSASETTHPLPLLYGELVLALDSAQRLTAASLARSTDAPELDAALLEAAWRADSASAFVGLPAAPTDSLGRVHLELKAGERLDKEDVTLSRILVGYVAVDVPVGIAFQPSAAAPPGGRREMTADLTFVVGTDGLAEPASIRALGSSEPEAAAAAIDFIRRSQFTPAASRGGCPVRQLAQQRVVLQPTLR